MLKSVPPALLLLSLAVASTPQALAQTGPTQLVLTNGDTLSGTVLGREEGAILLQHELLGEIRLPEARIQETRFAAGGEAPADEPAPQPAAEAPERLLEPLLPGWERQFDLGISGSEGNSQSRNIHGALTAKTESPEYRWDVQLANGEGRAVKPLLAVSVGSAPRSTNCATRALLPNRAAIIKGVRPKRIR